MTKWTAIVVLAILSALAGLVAWLRYEFDPTTAAVALLALFGVVVFAGGALLSLASQRATLNAIVDFQAADDRGEVARAKMLTEVIRHNGKIATQDNAQMWREVRNTSELPAPDVWTPAPQRRLTVGMDDDVVIDG